MLNNDTWFNMPRHVMHWLHSLYYKIMTYLIYFLFRACHFLFHDKACGWYKNLWTLLYGVLLIFLEHQNSVFRCLNAWVPFFPVCVPFCVYIYMYFSTNIGNSTIQQLIFGVHKALFFVTCFKVLQCNAGFILLFTTALEKSDY